MAWHNLTPNVVHPDPYSQSDAGQPVNALDRRIDEIGSIYGDYADALGGTVMDYGPYRQAYNQFFGTPAYNVGGGSYQGFGVPATGAYAPIQGAFGDANEFFTNQQTRAADYFGDQEDRYGTYFDEQQVRYGDVANQFADLAMGTINPVTGRREGGFYNQQYGGTMGSAGAIRDMALGEAGPGGERVGGFYANQYDQSTALAERIQELLTGGIDPETGLATGGLYGSAYDASASLHDTIYETAAGVLGEGGAMLGGFYGEQAANMSAQADAAFAAAAAEAVPTSETRVVVDEFDQPVMEAAVAEDGSPILDDSGQPVMQEVTEQIVEYQGGFYSVQEANQIRRANVAQTQAAANAARIREEQVRVANVLFNTATDFFTNERDAAIGMLAAMEGVDVEPDASPEEIAASVGVRGRYAQQFSFFGDQEQRGIAELARQIMVINEENLRRSGRVSQYETLMVGEPDPVTGERTGGRIGTAEQALLERIGGLQSAATAEMDTVRAAEEQRLTDLRSGYGADISGAVAALQAQGIDPTQLQAMTAQTGALLGAQEASQLAMLERLQRAEGMLGSEQELDARMMADEARIALENQLFSARTGIEEDIYGRLEGVERQKYGVTEGARTGQFTAGQTRSAALDELAREAFGYGSQARTGVFGAQQEMTGAVSAAGLGEIGRVFDAAQVRNAAVGAAQDTGRAGRFVAGQQRDAMIAEGEAARDVGRFNARNAYDLAMAQAQQGLLQGSVQSQMGFEESMADAWAAQNLGQFQTESLYAGAQAEAAAARNAGMFGAQQELYQSIFEALQQQQAGAFTAGETAAAGIFGAGEAATAGMFDAGQQADADTRALEQSQFEQMMQLAMSEASGLSGLQGDLAQGGLSRDLAIMQAQQQSESAMAQAEAATAAGVAASEAWFAPGSATGQALFEMGYTPESIAGFDNTTLRAIVTDYNDAVKYQNENVQTALPWDQNLLYNQETGAWGSMGDYPGTGFSGGGITGFDQAAAAGFKPWQDPISYSNPEYARGVLPGSFGYQTPSQPWIGNAGQGVGMELGRFDEEGFILENLPTLKAYGNLHQLPYPSEVDISSDPATVQTWYRAVFEKLTGQAAPAATVP